MELFSSIADWRNYASEVRASGRRVGLVPTMGALHEGHASLFEKAKSNGDVVLATIRVTTRHTHVWLKLTALWRLLTVLIVL